MGLARWLALNRFCFRSKPEHLAEAIICSRTSLNTMFAPATTIEQLPANIPQLEPNGVNWAIFMMRFKDAMRVTRRWNYFILLQYHVQP